MHPIDYVCVVFAVGIALYTVGLIVFAVREEITHRRFRREPATRRARRARRAVAYGAFVASHAVRVRR